MVDEAFFSCSTSGLKSIIDVFVITQVISPLFKNWVNEGHTGSNVKQVQLVHLNQLTIRVLLNSLMHTEAKIT